MQAGLTPLTFTVRPRLPPGLLALRPHRVKDPKPSANDHHNGWARAPHTEPAAPKSSATGAHRQPNCYRQGLLQDTAQPSEPGVARANDAIQPEVSIGSHETRKNGAERRGPFLASPGWRVRSIAHAVSLQRGWERSTKAIR